MFNIFRPVLALFGKDESYPEYTALLDAISPHSDYVALSRLADHFEMCSEDCEDLGDDGLSRGYTYAASWCHQLSEDLRKTSTR